MKAIKLGKRKQVSTDEFTGRTNRLPADAGAPPAGAQPPLPVKLFEHMNPGNFYAMWRDVSFGLAQNQWFCTAEFKSPDHMLQWFVGELLLLHSLVERMEFFAAHVAEIAAAAHKPG